MERANLKDELARVKNHNMNLKAKCFEENKENTVNTVQVKKVRKEHIEHTDYTDETERKEHEEKCGSPRSDFSFGADKNE